jgi:hypothetical protein
MHEDLVSSKRLSSINSDFERGVFIALYTSRRQRLRRLLAQVLLVIKHGLRGTLFCWPLYLLPLAAAFFKVTWLPLILLLLLPGLLLSGVILLRGVREDYARLVNGYILKPGYAGRVLFPGRLAP